MGAVHRLLFMCVLVSLEHFQYHAYFFLVG